MLHKAWNSKGEMPYCFSRSSVKFQGHTGQSTTNFDPNWAFPDYRPVTAFKSLRFALFGVIHQISRLHGQKNDDLIPILSKNIRPVTAIKSLRFALFSPVYSPGIHWPHWSHRIQLTGSLYPHSTEGGMGVYWIHPDVCPTVTSKLIKKGFTINRLKNTMKKCLGKHSWIAKKYKGRVIQNLYWCRKYQ